MGEGQCYIGLQIRFIPVLYSPSPREASCKGIHVSNGGKDEKGVLLPPAKTLYTARYTKTVLITLGKIFQIGQVLETSRSLLVGFKMW